jgi:pheromone a factor receptor
MTEMMCTAPLAAFVIWLNATTQPIEPWKGLADAHFDFSRFEQLPAVIWRQNHLLVVSMELTRWLPPICAFIFFTFFGFAEEARKHYRMIYWASVKPFGFSPSVSQSSVNSFSVR